MRCKFCGWDNPQGKETCEKCNKPLGDNVNVAPVAVSNNDRPTARKPADIPQDVNLKATIREAAVGGRTVNEEKAVCPECGYPLESGVCASCGYTENKEDEKQPIVPIIPAGDVRKTVRPIRKGEKEGTFSLVPISEETGEPEGVPLTYEGNETLLNRYNTDPKNQTITSAKQAVVKCENGVWSIEDCSEYKTTFVQASRNIELQKGDLILLGNQLYRFDA